MAHKTIALTTELTGRMPHLMWGVTFQELFLALARPGEGCHEGRCHVTSRHILPVTSCYVMHEHHRTLVGRDASVANPPEAGQLSLTNISYPA